MSSGTPRAMRLLQTGVDIAVRHRLGGMMLQPNKTIPDAE
jgi:hypothetical protein